MTSPLFRDEVLDADHKRALGRVLLIQPLSHTLLAIVAFCIFVTLALVLIFCSYTRRTEVSGVLEPSQGVIKLYAPVNGRLKATLVEEGQLVRKGDVLLVFSTEHDTANGQIMEENEDNQLKLRLGALNRERHETQLLQKADAEVSRESLAALRRNQKNLLEQIEVQVKRVQMAENGFARYEQLQHAGYLSDIQVQAKRDESLDQQLKLQTMQNQMITNEAEIKRLDRQLIAAPSREAVSDSQFVRSISSTQTELNQHAGNHEWSIVAPCDGTIAALAVNKHQIATVSVPLITLVPTNGVLQANLYAPSKALGFIAPGQRVNLKLDAYPYQQFGMVIGEVKTIAGIPALPSEITSATRLLPSGVTDEPAYSIRVTLNQQTIQAYGRPQALRPGVQVSAEIELDTRRLYEWVLEPLYR